MSIMGIRKLMRDGSVAEVGADAFTVYVMMRDLVWRSSDKGLPELRKAWSEGLLAVMVRQEKLGRLIGVSPRTLRRLLCVLEKKGWIHRRRIAGETSLVVLGRVEAEGEVWIADERSEPAQVDGKNHVRTFGQNRQGDPEVLEEKKEDLETVIPVRPIRRAIPSDPTPRKIHEVEEEKEEPEAVPAGIRRAWLELDQPPPAKRRKVVDEESGRQLHPTEFDHLQNARRKREAKDYSGEEAVAVWRHLYFRAFNVEDLALESATARRKMAITFVQRTVDWSISPRQLATYLGDMVRMWAAKKPGDKSPVGEVPRLAMLLKKTPDGPSWFFEQWRAGRSKREGAARK